MSILLAIPTVLLALASDAADEGGLGRALGLPGLMLQEEDFEGLVQLLMQRIAEQNPLLCMPNSETWIRVDPFLIIVKSHEKSIRMDIRFDFGRPFRPSRSETQFMIRCGVNLGYERKKTLRWNDLLKYYPWNEQKIHKRMTDVIKYYARRCDQIEFHANAASIIRERQKMVPGFSMDKLWGRLRQEGINVSPMNTFDTIAKKDRARLFEILDEMYQVPPEPR